MQRLLGTLELSHTKPKAIFPQSVLGHLFLRKFGLSREQRSHLLRATGGSSRFDDVVKILRASDIEDPRADDRRPQRPRREAYVVQEADSSSSLGPLTSDESENEQAMHVDEDDSQGSGTEEDVAEILAIQQKAKRDFKKNFRTYKESKKKMKEIRKSRQPYMSVIAVPPPDGTSTAAPSTAPRQSSLHVMKRNPLTGSQQSL